MFRMHRELFTRPPTNKLFRALSSKVQSPLNFEITPGFTAIKSYFQSAFSNESISKTESAKIKSIGQTVTKHYQQSKKYQSGVQINIEELIKNTSEITDPHVRLSIICQTMRNNPVRPVITSHPTRVKSNEAIFKIHQIVSLALEIDELEGGSSEYMNILRTIWSRCQSLVTGPFLQATKLSPHDEAVYGQFIFTKMIESLPSFRKMLIEALHRELGIDRQIIEHKIDAKFIRSCIDLRSWVKGDADGNTNTTAESMSQTVPTHQIGMLQVYIDKTEDIRKDVESIYADKPNTSHKLIKILNSSVEYYNRCIKSIQSHIWFEEEGSNNSVRISVEKLTAVKEELLAKFPHNSKVSNIIKKIDDLIDVIELARFTGGMREYVRQTTELNTRVLNNLFDIIRDHAESPAISLFQQKAAKTRTYADLSLEEKINFQELLGQDPSHFQTLQKNKDKFTEETQNELQRLSFITNNKGLFPFYICSNTESKNNFNEVSVLMSFARYLINNNLHIGEMNSFLVNMIFLVESPKDMQNLGNILDDIFSDRNLRARISQSGFISCVLGPSDLGKEGGVATHISLYFGRLLCQEKLAEYQNKYPELKDVNFLFLNGYGADYKRRIQRSGKQSHATFQGVSAYLELGAPFAFLDYISANAGRKPQSDVRVDEIVSLRENSPELFDLLTKLEKSAVPEFEKFIKQPAVKQLLEALTDLTVEDRLNISSRAASKSQSKKDVTKLRAIGTVNIYIYMLLNFDIFMGVRGWDDLKLEDSSKFNALYRQSGVLQDIVHKVLFSLVISDIDRAWKLLNQGEIPCKKKLDELYANYQTKLPEERTPHDLLAYIHLSAEIILQKLMEFAPPSRHPAINEYLLTDKNSLKSISTRALELMEIIGDEYLQLAKESRFILADAQELAVLIDEYTANKSEDNLEAVVRGIRAGNSGLFWGPDSIADRRVGVIPDDSEEASLGSQLK